MDPTFIPTRGSIILFGFFWGWGVFVLFLFSEISFLVFRFENAHTRDDGNK